MCNLLEIPHRCSDREGVYKKFREIINNKDVVFLPVAVIIETGNHIAHIDDGNRRRTIAEKFCIYIRRTINGEAPWNLLSNEMDIEMLRLIADSFTERAVKEHMGIGDMGIIESYNRHRRNVAGNCRVLIWSMDDHLKAYSDTAEIKMERR